jgi:hypothetical protein
MVCNPVARRIHNRWRRGMTQRARGAVGISTPARAQLFRYPSALGSTGLRWYWKGRIDMR